jgi:uncharacterized LabA/DUF88 family protein
MAKNIKRIIYIDASNLYGGVSKLLRPGEYVDFSTLLPVIDQAFSGIDEFKAYGAYMGSAGVQDPLQLLFIKAQNEFFNDIRALKGVYFGKGNISKHGKEKGVDMQLGVDMVHDAHTGAYDEAIIFTGDADFFYPIQIVQNLGYKVHLCAFATRFTIPMSFKTDKKVVLDYTHYFSQNIAPQARRLPKDLEVIDIDRLVKIKKA